MKAISKAIYQTLKRGLSKTPGIFLKRGRYLATRLVKKQQDYWNTRENIFRIMKFNISIHLVVEGSHHAVIKSIAWMIANNGLPLLKDNFPLALFLYRGLQS
jgi:hypothetical protein